MKITDNVKWLTLALVLSGPAVAQQDSGNEISDEIIAYWAQNALPLAEFVKQGFGMAEPEDAFSPEWCSYQFGTISLLYANSVICERLIREIRKQGRLE